MSNSKKIKTICLQGAIENSLSHILVMQYWKTEQLPQFIHFLVGEGALIFIWIQKLIRFNMTFIKKF